LFAATGTALNTRVSKNKGVAIKQPDWRLPGSHTQEDTPSGYSKFIDPL
jgi:hypothetical protein